VKKDMLAVRDNKHRYCQTLPRAGHVWEGLSGLLNAGYTSILLDSADFRNACQLTGVSYKDGPCLISGFRVTIR
jgi:hypothetical protein